MYIYITKVSLKYANEVKYIVSTSIKILTLVITRNHLTFPRGLKSVLSSEILTCDSFLSNGAIFVT